MKKIRTTILLILAALMFGTFSNANEANLESERATVIRIHCMRFKNEMCYGSMWGARVYGERVFVETNIN